MSATSRGSALVLIAAFAALAVLYLSGDVACRLGGLLARHEHRDAGDQRPRDEGGPYDWSSPGGGLERNQIAREWRAAEMTWASQPSAPMYAPLCALEQWYRNQPSLPHPRARW